MAWLVLVVAGFMESVWAIALSKSNGLRRLWPTVIFVVASVVSLGGLAVAMASIPTGTAYAVWTGIGAIITVIWALVMRQEKASTAKILLLIGLVGCVIGLKVMH
ncbi:DMT family transporter [Streptomyces sp. CA-106131]|uniref:DMT family transporter n=1 Tax=Streptomyces sp. CA-106131 TaxID=3240045 RepID=UPI003D8A36BC